MKSKSTSSETRSFYNKATDTLIRFRGNDGDFVIIDSHLYGPIAIDSPKGNPVSDGTLLDLFEGRAVEGWEHPESAAETGPTWAEIRGKARYYCTARIRSSGEYVAIIRIVDSPVIDGQINEPLFICKGSSGIEEHFKTEELFQFGL